jgi:hypothetical protein
VDDDHLAALVAADLRQNLRARAPQVRDVYGICLWSDDVYGDFLISFACEDDFEQKRQIPAYAAQPEEALRAPSGIRWSVGDWHTFPDDDFVTPETKAALAPLISRLQDVTLPEEELAAESERWRELTFAVFDLAQPLDLLPCTDDAIAFIGFDELTVDQQLELMSRTVPAERLQAIFPQWRSVFD